LLFYFASEVSIEGFCVGLSVLAVWIECGVRVELKVEFFVHVGNPWK